MHTLSLLVLSLTYISAPAASFLWSAMASDGYRAPLNTVYKTRRIRKEFLSAAKSIRTSFLTAISS